MLVCFTTIQEIGQKISTKKGGGLIIRHGRIIRILRYPYTLYIYAVLPSDNGAIRSDVRATSERCRSDVGATSERRRSDVRAITRRRRD